MTKAEIEAIKVAIANAIKINVNGKIDELSSSFEAHQIEEKKIWARVVPVVEAFESSERALVGTKKAGRILLSVAGAITSLGGAYLLIKPYLHF